MLMPSRPSLGGGEVELRVQRVQHGGGGGGGGAKLIPPLSLPHPPFLWYRILIDADALRYRPQPIEPLTAMVLGRQLQEQAGAEEGR